MARTLEEIMAELSPEGRARVEAMGAKLIAEEHARRAKAKAESAEAATQDAETLQKPGANGTAMRKTTDRLLRVRDIIPGKLPIGRSTLWLWVRQGRLPAGIKPGPKTTVWKESELDAAIAVLMSKRSRNPG